MSALLLFFGFRLPGMTTAAYEEDETDFLYAESPEECPDVTVPETWECTGDSWLDELEIEEEETESGEPFDISWGVIPLDDGTGCIYVDTFSCGEEEILLEVPDQVSGLKITALDDGCFAALAGQLSGVTLPGSLQKIGEDAFSGCSRLEQIILPSSLKEISADAFAGSGITDFLTPDPGSVYESRNGVLFRKAVGGGASVLAVYPPGRKDERYIIPIDTRSIDAYAFSGNRFLHAVMIPEGVVYIGDFAFSACSELEQLLFPDSVMTLGKYVCSDCVSLQKARLPLQMSILEEGSFCGCPSLTEVEIPPGSEITVVEPAFEDCPVEREDLGLPAVFTEVTEEKETGGFLWKILGG